jgi:peptide/nickel transport system permease protein
MGAYLVRRLLLIIPTLVFVTMLVFLLVRFIPGSVIEVMEAQQRAAGTEEALNREQILALLGLDKPIFVQYGLWVADIFQGNLGESVWSGKEVTESLKDRIPISFELGILGLIIGQLVAIPVGILSAIRQDTIQDYLSRTAAILFMCIPSFWLGTIVMIYPAIWWQWSPPMEYIPFIENPLGNLGMFIIPAAVLGLHAAGTTMRMTRTMMLEVLRQDYIRTAWSKGLKEKVIVLRHAIKNALIPVITMIGMQVPILVGGTVVIEQIFNLPGMGRLMLDALNSRDYPIVSGVNLFIACFVLVVNLLVDLTYSWLDPRIRYR